MSWSLSTVFGNGRLPFRGSLSRRYYRRWVSFPSEKKAKALRVALSVFSRSGSPPRVAIRDVLVRSGTEMIRSWAAAALPRLVDSIVTPLIDQGGAEDLPAGCPAERSGGSVRGAGAGKHRVLFPRRG